MGEMGEILGDASYDLVHYYMNEIYKKRKENDHNLDSFQKGII